MEGATQGALSAFGSAEDKFGNFGDTLGQMAGGALLGGGLSGGISLLPGTLQGVANLVKRAPSAEEITRRASAIVMKALERDAVRPTDMAGRVRTNLDQGVPALFGESGGRNLAALSDVVMREPGREAAALTEDVARLQGGARERVTERVGASLTGGKDYDAQLNAVTEQLRKTYETAYEPAFKINEVMDPAIDNILDTETMRPIWSKAMRLAQADADAVAAETGRKAVNPLREYLAETKDAAGNVIRNADGDPVYGPSGKFAPSVQALDYLKRAADKVIESGFRKGGVDAAEAASLKRSRNALIGRLDTVVPEYAAARAKYAGEAEVRDAFKLGMNEDGMSFDKMRFAELEKWIAKASDAEREALRTARGNKLINDAQNTKRGTNWAEGIIGSEGQLKKLKLLYDDPKEFETFKAALEAESKFYKGRSSMLYGSATAGRLASKADVEAAMQNERWGDVANLIINGSRGNILAVGQGMLRMMQGKNFSPETYDAVAAILRKGDPDDISQAVRMIAEASKRTLAQSAAAEKVAEAVGVGAAKTLGGPPDVGPTTGTPEEISAEMPGELPEEATQASYATGEGGSVGERNNNSGNIIDGAFAKRQPGYDGVGEGGFAKFKTPEAGNAAQETLLANNYLSQGFNTVDKIVEKYTPRSDPRNTPETLTNYKAYIAGRLGIGVNDLIPATMVSALSQAMREFETGKGKKGSGGVTIESIGGLSVEEYIRLHPESAAFFDNMLAEEANTDG